MDQTVVMDFINKAIEKTKTGSLNWSTLNATSIIKPIPEDNSSLPGKAKKLSLFRTSSYGSQYGDGELLLLVSSENNYISSPPDDCILSLRMQDSKSKYAVEIANTYLEYEIAVSLIRLYNLIDKDVSSINSLINDFLNS